MSNAREITCKLIEAVEEGALSWESIARASLCYMSEADVKDMAECECLIEEEKEEVIIDYEYRCTDCGTNTAVFNCSFDNNKIDLCSDCVEVRNEH